MECQKIVKEKKANFWKPKVLFLHQCDEYFNVLCLNFEPDICAGFSIH